MANPEILAENFAWRFSIKQLLLATLWIAALLAIYSQAGWRSAGFFVSFSLLVAGLRRLPLWPMQLVASLILLVF
jgi:hypothetical protein